MNAPVANFTQFAEDVRSGLGRAGQRSGQRELPPAYLYDELGSALFEAITVLPEYGLTRADSRILTRHAREIAEDVAAGSLVVELGSGTGSKTRAILEAIGRRSGVPEYYPIDVSAGALRACEAELGTVSRVRPIHAPYLEGLRQAGLRRGGKNVLLLFLGSTIGNFDRAAGARFLEEIRTMLIPGDSLLIGLDLVKPVPQMLLAYDDPAGVTAAFNKNVLGRMNRELGANFDLRSFEHEARWNANERRIEMHLRSLRLQRIDIPAAELVVPLEQGETIRTESSYKFQAEELAPMAAMAGFTEEARWTDSEWPMAECLWHA